MFSFIITPLLAFLLGFALARANSCTVAAVHRLIVGKKYDWLRGLVVAAAASALTIYPLYLFFPDIFGNPQPLSIGLSVLLGGATLGLGALVNGSCMLGSVSLLGRGDLNFAFMLIGVLIAFLLQRTLPYFPAPEILQASGNELGQRLDIALLVVFAVAVFWSMRRLLRHGERQFFWLLSIGVLGGLLFAANPYWSYTSALNRLSLRTLFASDISADIAAGTIFFGATASAILRDRLALVRPGIYRSSRSLVGGLLMGIGAIIIPGGNDVLLLWSIPSYALYGLVAYLVMIATIAIGLFVSQRRSKGWLISLIRKPE